MNEHPRITFLFPYRWLKEDKQYFPANAVRQVKKAVGPDGVKALQVVTLYKIIVSYQSYLPVNFSLTKTMIQKILKPVFPNAKCLDIAIEYTQHKSRTMLPLFDFQIYY